MLKLRFFHSRLLLTMLALSISLGSHVPTSAQTKGRGFALLIGIDDYSNVKVEGFKSLKTCVNDVLQLGKVLKEQGFYDERICRIIKDQPNSLLDNKVDLIDPLFKNDRPILLEEGREKQTIISQIDRVVKATLDSRWTQDDFVLVYLSCHGLYKDGNLYFLLPNTNLRDPNTYITFEQIATLFRFCPATVVFIFDACNAGGYAPEGSFDAKKQHDEYYESQLQAHGSRRVVIPSCSDAKEFSYELSEEKSGLFTYCLIKALKGEAGGPDITLGQIMKYLADNVGKVAKTKGLNQTVSPDVIYDGSRGKANFLVLAKTKNSPVLTLLKDRVARELEQSGGAALNNQKIPGEQDLEDAQQIMRQHLLKFAHEETKKQKMDLSDSQIVEAVAQVLIMPEKSLPPDKWAETRFASPPGEKPLSPDDVHRKCEAWFNVLKDYLRSDGQPDYYFGELRKAGIPPVLRFLVVKDSKGYGKTLDSGEGIDCVEEQLTFHVAASLVSDKFRLIRQEEGQRKVVEFLGVMGDAQNAVKIARNTLGGIASKCQGAGSIVELTGKEFQIRIDDLKKKSNVMEFFIEEETPQGEKIYSPPFTLTVTCPANVTLGVPIPKETNQSRLRLEGKVWDRDGRPRVFVQLGEKKEPVKVDEQPDRDGLYGWTADLQLQKGSNALIIEAFKPRPPDKLIRPSLKYLVELKEKLLPVVIEEFKENIPDGIIVKVDEKPFQGSLAEAVVNPNGPTHIEVLKNGVKLLEGKFPTGEQGISKKLTDLTPVTFTVEFDTSKIADKSQLKDLSLKPQRIWLSDLKQYGGSISVPSPNFERNQGAVELPVGEYNVELKGKDSDIWYAVADGQASFSVAERKKVSLELRRYTDGRIIVSTQPVGKRFTLKPADREGEPRIVTENEKEVKNIPAGYYYVEGTQDSKHLRLQRFEKLNDNKNGRLDYQRDEKGLRIRIPSASKGQIPQLIVPFGVPTDFFPVPMGDEVNKELDSERKRLILDSENESGPVVVSRKLAKELVYWKGELKNSTLSNIEGGFVRVAAQWQVKVPPQTSVWLEPTNDVPYFNVYKDRKPQKIPAEVKAGGVEWKDKMPVGFYTLKVQLPGLLQPIPIETVPIEETANALQSLDVPLLARLGEEENLKKVKAAIPVCETVTVKATRKGKPLDDGAMVRLALSQGALPPAAQTFEALKQGQAVPWIDDLLKEFNAPQSGQSVQKGSATFRRVWAGQYDVMLQLKGKSPRPAKLSNKQKATLTIPAQSEMRAEVFFPQIAAVFKSVKPEIGLRGLELVPASGGAPIAIEGDKEARTEDVDSDVLYLLQWKKSAVSPRWTPVPNKEIKISDDKEEESFDVHFERNKAKVIFNFKLDDPGNAPPCLLRPKPEQDDKGWEGADVPVPLSGQKTELPKVEVGRYEVSEGWELMGEKPSDNVGRLEVSGDGGQSVFTLRKQIYTSRLKRRLPEGSGVFIQVEPGKEIPLFDKSDSVAKNLPVGDFTFIVRKDDKSRLGKIYIRRRGDDTVALIKTDDKGNEMELDRIVDIAWRLPTPNTQLLKFSNSPDIKKVEVNFTYTQPDSDGTRKRVSLRLTLKRQEQGNRFLPEGKWEDRWKMICPRLKDFDPKNPKAEMSPFFADPDDEKQYVLEVSTNYAKDNSTDKGTTLVINLKQ